MGARSCARGLYLLLLSILMQIGAYYCLATVSLLTATITDSCGASVLSYSQGGGRLAGYSASATWCQPSLNYYADFQLGCFSCSGSTTTWPCLSQQAMPLYCTANGNVSAKDCTTQNLPTGPYNGPTKPGRLPLVSPTTTAAADLSRCAAAIGAPAAYANACTDCLNAGSCLSTTAFTGAGFYLDATYNTTIPCFTTPQSVTLRTYMPTMLTLTVIAFFICTFFLVITAFILFVCFAAVRGRQWSELTCCPRVAACTVRAGPYTYWIARWLLVITLVAEAYLYWGVGACRTYLDTAKEVQASNQIEAAVCVGLVCFGAFIILSAVCRPCLTGDAALIDVTVVDADDADAEKNVTVKRTAYEIARTACSDILIAAGP